MPSNKVLESILESYTEREHANTAAKLYQAINLKDVLLDNLWHTPYDHIGKILILGDHLSKVTAIIEMLELVGTIPDSFSKWLDAMTFSPYQ